MSGSFCGCPALMNFEVATDAWLRKLILAARTRAGEVFVEVGLGGGDWSFVWASQAGLRCLVVEPAPTEKLRDLCGKCGVEMVVAAVCEREGTILLYEGELNGAQVGDTNSTRPDWWGVGERSRPVSATTLAVLARSWNGVPFIALKVDVEGAEASVLSGLNEFAPGQLPKLVAFEYGGGGSLKDQRGGWADEFVSSTMSCLNLLKDLGYKGGMILERSSWSPRLFKMAGVGNSARTMFDEADEVGNIIVWKDPMEDRLKPGWFLQHHFVQTGCAVSHGRQHCHFWLNHWGIRGLGWLRKRCGLRPGASPGGQ